MSPRASLLLVLLAACKPKPGDLPVCLSDVGSSRADEADTRILPTRAWFQLLVPRISLPNLLPPDDPRECSGKQIAVTWPDVPKTDKSAPDAVEALPRREVTDADLTFGEGPDNAILIWARIAFFADGTALGPVALVLWTSRGIEIRGIGTLRAPTRRARLRLEPLGSDAQVLVADGELCPDGPTTAGKPRCRREVYLLPLVEQRFLQAELLVEDGTSLGPARIFTFEEHDAPLRDGWIRHSEVRRSIRFKDAQVTIGEVIRIRDCDPKTNLEVCDEQEAIHGQHSLVWRENQFVTTARSTWNEMPR